MSRTRIYEIEVHAEPSWPNHCEPVMGYWVGGECWRKCRMIDGEWQALGGAPFKQGDGPAAWFDLPGSPLSWIPGYTEGE